MSRTGLREGGCVRGSGRRGRALLPIVALAVAVAGCGGAPPARLLPRPDYLDADRATLLQIANSWTAESLRAEGELRMYWSPDDNGRHVDARLFATRAGSLKLVGRRSLAGEIFDLVADGTKFQLKVPDHAAIYSGTPAAPIEPDPERPYFSLRPHHITEALLPEPLPVTDVPGAYVILSTLPDRYGLEWVEIANAAPRVLRRVWIERVGLTVSRIEVFGGDGRIEFVARYSGYIAAGASSYPGVIEVDRPWEELRFRFDLDEVMPNPQIPAIAFDFPDLPPGYRTLTIEEAMAEFRRGGGG